MQRSRDGADVPRAAAGFGALSPLRRKVVSEIAAICAAEAEPALAEQDLAARIGVSRSPVSFALKAMEEEGFLAREGRGALVRAAPRRDFARLEAALRDIMGEGLYERLADDRIAGALPEAISEAELMRRYGAARGGVVGALSRAAAEGWVERQVGHGWRFLPLIEGPEAYAESYAFRAAIEPAGLRLPGFAPDPEGLASLRARQERIVEGGYRTMGARELFEANAEFHETLAAWSGNRFILEALARVDHLRRLVEYRLARGDRGPRRAQAAGHLEILDALERGDREAAARLLERHLKGAATSKAIS